MSKRKLLLIDDDAAVLQYMAARLGAGYQVLTSTQPLSALATARTERPDLILCDLDMPVMSGSEVVAALAADPLTAPIPVMYLTALVSPEEARDLHGEIAGRRAISKQSPVVELVLAIEDVVRGGREAGAGRGSPALTPRP